MNIKKILIWPLVRRIGTAVAASISTYLLAVGISEELVTQIGIGMAAVGMVAFDLVLAAANDQKKL